MTRYGRERKLRIAYISRAREHERDMYIIFRVTLNFTARSHREHVDVFIWTRAPQLIRLSTCALCMRALVINCHNLYARNSYFTLAILPAKEIISLGNACSVHKHQVLTSIVRRDDSLKQIAKLCITRLALHSFQRYAISLEYITETSIAFQS